MVSYVSSGKGAIRFSRDGRGIGFYFRNVTELVLFGIRGKNNRTREAGRRQTNIVISRKREHSRKPEELYEMIERCSSGQYVEMFARFARFGWSAWGNEAETGPRTASKPFRGINTHLPVIMPTVLPTEVGLFR